MVHVDYIIFLSLTNTSVLFAVKLSMAMQGCKVENFQDEEEDTAALREKQLKEIANARKKLRMLEESLTAKLICRLLKNEKELRALRKRISRLEEALGNDSNAFLAHARPRQANKMQPGSQPLQSSINSTQPGLWTVAPITARGTKSGQHHESSRN